MRLIIILLIAGCLQVSAKGYGQKINISGKDIPLEKVFNMIKNQTGYVFFYDYAIFRDARTVSLDIKQGTIEDVLNACLNGQGMEFKIEDKTVSITKSKAEQVIGTQADATSTEDNEIMGVVTLENGSPLAGATVTILKLNRIGISNQNGEFVFQKVPNGKYMVEISYVGYEKMTSEIVVAGNAAKINAILKQATNRLDEAVVIPYGKTTERLNTGDITTVTSKEIERQPVSNVLAALEGRVPGLVITQQTGLPGGGFTVQIRGKNSISSSNDPFYVIDGVPYNSQLPTVTGYLLNSSLGNGSPLNFINPYDIESVEVLKDADATAIYGSRAANGAILITTKKGRPGAMKVDLSLNSGVTGPARDIKFLNTQQYLAMRHEAFANDGATPDPNNDFDLTYWDSTRYTDWSKVFLNAHPVFTDAEASVSGGTNNIQYSIGGGYNFQTTGEPTIIPGDGGDRKGSLHFNINTLSQNKRFKISLTGNYVSDRNTVQSVDFASWRYNLAPNAPALFNPDGSLNWDPMAPGQTGTWRNPYAYLYQGYKGLSSNLVGNVALSYTLLPGLEFKTSMGYTSTEVNEVRTVPTTAFDPGYHLASGNSHFQTTNGHSWIIEPDVNYSLHIGQGILNALLGATFDESISNSQAITASGFISDALLQDVQAASNTTIYSNQAQYKYNAVFGRLNYDWMDKYLVNFTARRDGSSRFGPGKQFGNFGAIGAGWIFTKENFMQNAIPFLSFGKFRGSYGTTGNDQIGDYQFLDLYSVTSNPYQNAQGIYPQNLFNPELAWEVDKKLEGGIELGFLKDRITIQASIYRNRCGNQLISANISQVTGYSSIPYNSTALVQNSGQEFVLHTINIKGRDFSWSSSFNLSFSKNKLLAYPKAAISQYNPEAFKIGQPINSILAFHMIGVNDTTGVYQFSDAKGNPTYNPNYPVDAISRVNLAPKFYGGFENGINYKGFSLDFLFQFTKQMGTNLFGEFGSPTGIFNNVPVNFLDHWQKPGDKKTYEMFTQNYGGNAYNAYQTAQQSDFAYSDASFIRLKNIALSWQIPTGWKQKMHFESCRLYINAQNLLTITHFNGTDPESQSINSVPKRVITGGLQVTF